MVGVSVKHRIIIISNKNHSYIPTVEWWYLDTLRWHLGQKYYASSYLELKNRKSVKINAFLLRFKSFALFTNYYDCFSMLLPLPMHPLLPMMMQATQFLPLYYCVGIYVYVRFLSQISIFIIYMCRSMISSMVCVKASIIYNIII